MGLVRCVDCGAEVSERAAQCIKCGGPIGAAPQQAGPVVMQAPREPVQVELVKRGGGCLPVIGLIVLLLIALAYLGGRSDVDDVPMPAASRYTGANTRDVANWQVVGSQGVMKFVVVPNAGAGSEADLKFAASSLCAGATHCLLHFWGDASAAARGLPLSDAALASRLATYVKNTDRQVDRWLWNCAVFTGKPSSECEAR